MYRPPVFCYPDVHQGNTLTSFILSNVIYLRFRHPATVEFSRAADEMDFHHQRVTCSLNSMIALFIKSQVTKVSTRLVY